MDHETIINLCNELQPLYFCGSDEIGLEESTPHTHVFIVFEHARAFSTIKKMFPSAHIDVAKGTNQENKEYVFKEGKWLGNAKEDTNLKETHFEVGEIPLNEQGKRNDLSIIHEMINDGYDAMDIVIEYPQFSLQLDKIKQLINGMKEKRYGESKRENLQVIYIWGSTGKGKTSYVMNKYGCKNVCRITDYKHPFDIYNCQDVLMFEEFREDIAIKDMLKYLDVWPTELPARYGNKTACYTKVYIVSNISILEQYRDIQHNEKETYRALIRRIHAYMEFDEYGNKMVFTSYDDLKNRLYIPLEEYEKGGE